MKKYFSIFLLSSFLSSCSPASPSLTSQVVNIYATSAAQPWLGDLYDCAAETSATLNVAPAAPEILIRLGESEELSTPAFQIGLEDLLVVVSSQSSLGSVTTGQARALFAGQGGASVQAWVYASDADAQKVFDQLVMNGRSVAPSARLAVNPSQMIEALRADANAVGILPRRWMTEGLREVLVLPNVPVLAVTPSEPQGVTRNLIACMQK